MRPNTPVLSQNQQIRVSTAQNVIDGKNDLTPQSTPRDVIFSKIDVEKTQQTNDFADSEFKLEHAKRHLEPLSFEEHRYLRNPSCRLEYDYLSFNQNQITEE